MEYNYNVEFLKLYKKLDYIKDTNPDLYYRFEERYEIITSFRNMRNVLCHVDNPGSVSKEFYDQLKDMVNKMTIKVSNVYIPLSKVDFAKLDTPLKEVIDGMDDNDYSFIPVIDNEQHLIYVISENSLIRIYSKNKELLNKDNVLVKDCVKYFDINNNPNYYFSFVGRNNYVSDIKDIFANEKDYKKCGMIFVSETGNKKEKLLGILTAWDVLGF